MSCHFGLLLAIIDYASRSLLSNAAYAALSHRVEQRPSTPEGRLPNTKLPPATPLLFLVSFGGTESLFFQAQARRDDDTTRGVAVDGDVAVSRVTSDDVIARHGRVAVGPARPSRPALLCPEGTENK